MTLTAFTTKLKHISITPQSFMKFCHGQVHVPKKERRKRKRNRKRRIIIIIIRNGAKTIILV